MTTTNTEISKSSQISKAADRSVRGIFFLCAVASVLCVLLITVFIFVQGMPIIKEVGLWDFITGNTWKPNQKIFGILPSILGTVYSTTGALIIGVPIGLFTAIFIAQYSPKPILKVLNPAIDLLAGIPSVVYGFFGLKVIVPMINETFGGVAGGLSLLAAMIILAVMVLPTVISTARVAIDAVPKKYIEGSMALGASKAHTIIHVILPAAKSGIFAGIVLGIGRAVGETMAVILVAGNAAIIPNSLTDPIKTMTTTIGMEWSYAAAEHRSALFATGIILFIFIMVLNIILTMIKRKGEVK